ncbi:histidine--tRNA ligase [Fontivita pretiosa]|uniref:histidine--tRNA ligase n=1 Tax=Fontivita pretiosa TaxID=2989684 RepID=UPI003D164648
MSRITAPKGTVDILPSESWKWQVIERIARQVAELYHFQEIRTPIFEHSELFHRGVGETSDIVHKETYTFQDRGGRSITLRPEQTAGVARAMIESSLLADPGARIKVYYIGPNFRYENVQKGRLRQHHQFGVEAFGVAEPEQDVECMLLQLDFYRRCGVKDLTLRINSLGDRQSKQRYRDVLVAHLQPMASQLSEDSQRRLSTNPLRILDSKDPRDIQACHSAPPAIESLSDRSRAHFQRVQTLLEQAGVKFVVDGKLVRGFDYYTDTLWEVTAEGLGAQNALGGGGRYDNLIETLGGRPTPGVGFGSGLERLLIALEAQGVSLPNPRQPLVWLISQDQRARELNLQLARELRDNNIACDMDLTGRSMKSQFKLADREGAAWCVIVGESELASGTVALKDLRTAQQMTIPRSDLVQQLQARIRAEAMHAQT